MLIRAIFNVPNLNDNISTILMITKDSLICSHQDWSSLQKENTKENRAQKGEA